MDLFVQKMYIFLCMNDASFIYLLLINLMARYKLHKLPSQNQNQVQQSFKFRKTGEEVDNNTTTLILGVISSMLYSLIFIYIYLSAYRSGHLTKKDFTLSNAFKHCEKVVSTILILATLCAIQFYYARQNIYSNDFRKNLVIFLTFAVVTSWLLLFFVWPEQKNAHAIVALVILFCTTLISVTVYYLYNDYYHEEDIIYLKATALSNLIIYSITILLGLITYIFYSKRKVNKLYYISHFLFSICEILGVVAFCVFMTMCATLPPLPNNDDIICFMK